MRPLLDRGFARAAAAFPLAGVVVSVLAPLLLAWGCGQKNEHPNVLLIIVDTLRADFVGCYGARPSVTPNIDRLAAGGALFTECVTPVPVTLPSVSSILTSSFPIFHGVRDNGIFNLDGSLVTMAEVLKEAGYSTGAVVGAYVLAERSGIDQGFDHFDSDFSGDYARESSLLEERAEEIARTQRRAAEVTDRALEWLDGTKQPFFLMAHYFDPHGPYDPPARYVPKSEASRTYKYIGEIAYTDEHLGRLLRAAEAASGERGLITAFVADHGEGLGQHDELQHGFLLYDSTLRVPFIVHYPGTIPPAMTAAEEVRTIDLAPTVLALAGIEPPATWQGKSLARRISFSPLDEATETKGTGTDSPCYIETYRTRYSYNWSEMVGIRYNGWKFVRAPRPELYDLSEDPAEKRNLYGERPDRLERMETLLKETIAAFSGPLAERGPTVDLDSEAIEKLEALGYVMPQAKPPSGPLPDPKDQMKLLNDRLLAKELIKRARAKLNAGNLDGAGRELRRALELDPKNAVAYHDLGAIFFEKGDFEAALPYFEKAANLEPTSEATREHLGIAYMKLGRAEDAARELEAAVALKPDNADLRLGYGKALLQVGDAQGALQQFYKSIELDPDVPAPYYQAAVVLRKLGKPAEASALLEEMLGKNPPASLEERARRMLQELAQGRR